MPNRSRHHSIFSIRQLAAALAIATTSVGQLWGSTGTWVGGSGEWTNPSNWTSAPIFPNAVDDVAVFLPATGNVTLNAPVTVGDLVIDAAAAITMGGGTGSLTLATSSGNGQIQFSTSGSSGVTFTTPIQFASDVTVQNLSLGTSANSAKNIVFAGPLSGSGNLVLSGPGEVLIRGTNPNWTPASIIVQSGGLSTVGGQMNSLGDPAGGTLTVMAGASVDISGLIPNAPYSGVAKSIVISGNGAPSLLSSSYNGALTYGATANTLLGPVVISGGATIYGKSATSVLNIGSPTGGASTASLSGSGPLTKSGAGTLAIHVASSYTGGTIVTGGTLLVSPYGSLVGTGNVTVYSGTRLSVAEPAGVNPNLNSVSPNSVLLAGGTLSIAADMPVTAFLNPSSSAGLLSIENGSSFTAGGTNTIDLSAFPVTSLFRMAFSNGVTVPATVSVIPDASHTVRIGSGLGGGSVALNAAFNDFNGIPTNIDVSAAGQTIVLGASNGYSGTTFVNSGTLSVTNVAGLGASSGATILSGGVVLASAATAEPFTVNSGTLNLLAAPSGALTLKGGITTISASGSSPIAVSGGSLVLSPASVWVPSISQTGGNITIAAGGLSGSLTVSAGSVSVNTPSSFLLTMNGGSASLNSAFGGPLSLNGGTTTLFGTLTGPATVTPGAYLRQISGAVIPGTLVTLSGGRFGIGTNYVLQTILSPSSTGGLISLENVASYTNGTTNFYDFNVIPGGSGLGLTTNTTATIPGTVTLRPDDASHTLRFGGGPSSGTLTVAAAITDFVGMPTNIAIAAPTTVVLTSTGSSFTGTTTVDGTLQVNQVAALGSASGSDADGTIVNATGRLLTASGVTLTTEKITAYGGTLNISTMGSVVINGTTGMLGTVAGPISGAGAISIVGTTSFVGVNSFSGPLTVQGGSVFTVQSSSSLGTLGSGTQLNAGSTLILSAASSEPIKNTGGALFLNGSYSGTLTQVGGSLSINSPLFGVGTLSNISVALPAQSQGSVTLTNGTIYQSVTAGTALTLNGSSLTLAFTQGSYTGPVTLNNSVLIITGMAGSTVIPLSAPLTVSGATTLVSPSFALLTAPAFTGSGTFTSAAYTYYGGGVAMDIGGPLTFSGTFIQNGSAHYQSIATSGLLVLRAATTVDTTVNHNGGISLQGGLNLSSGSSSASNMLISWSGALAVNSALTLDHLTVQSNYYFSEYGFTGNGALTVLDHTINLVCGELNFSGSAPGLTSIIKSSSNPARISSLPAGFAGTITHNGGLLTLPNNLNQKLTINMTSPDSILWVQGLCFNTAVNITGGSGTNPFAIRAAGGQLGTLSLGSAGAAVGIDNYNTISSLTLSNVSGGPLSVLPLTDLRLLTNNNSFNGLNIYRGTVRLRGALLSSAAITLGSASSFIIDNSQGTNNNRVPDGAPITMSGAWLEHAAATTGVSETLGTVTLARGSNTLYANASTSGVAAILTVSNFVRMPGAVASFEDGQVSTSTLGTSSTGPQIYLQGQGATDFLGPAYVFGLWSFGRLGYPPAHTGTFVKYGAYGVTPLVPSDYSTQGESTWNGTQIVRIPGNSTVSLTGSRSVKALKIGDLDGIRPASLNVGANTLNVESGAVLSNFGSSITGTFGGRLTAGGTASTAELILHGVFDLFVPITDNPGPDGQYDSVPGGPLDADNGKVSVTISGGGTFTMSAATSYTGTTYITSNGSLDDQAVGGVLLFPSLTNLPTGPIVIDYGRLQINATGNAVTGAITLGRGQILGSATLTPSSLSIEGGTVLLPVTGNGPITKTTPGAGTLTAFSNFTGSISVLGGTLTAPTQSYANSIIIDHASLKIQALASVAITGSLVMGVNSQLVISNPNQLGTVSFTLNPSSLSIDPSATIISNGDWPVGGSNDPFTDPLDPTKHANVTVTDPTGVNGSGTLFVTAGNKNINVLRVGAASVSAGATLSVQRLDDSNGLFATGNVTLRPGSATASRVGSITLAGATSAWTSRVDITDQTLVITPLANNRASDFTRVLNQLQSAYHGGDWQGNGITSSVVAASPASMTVALIDNSNLELSFFRNVVVDENAIILQPAIYGDADLSGAVDLADYDRWYKNVGIPSYSFTHGDFNMDGNIDLADYDLWYKHVGASAPLGSASASAAVNVPEPHSFALFSLASLLCVRRLRTRSRPS